MRVETERERYWFKAVFDHFRREPSVTAYIADLAPGLTAGVVASEASEGWMLLADLPGDAAPDEHGHRTAFEHLAQLQAITRHREHDLLAAGCARRALIEIPGDLANVLDDPMFGAWIPIDGARAERMVAWLFDAVQLVEQLGLPDVLVHGDFHPGNVRLVDDRIVIFDWSDAAIAKPFVDVMTWATWLPHDPGARDALWQSFAEVWADVLPPAMWLELRPDAGGDRRRLPRRQLRRHRAQPRSAPSPRARRRHDRVLRVPRRRHLRHRRVRRRRVRRSSLSRRRPRAQLFHA